MGSGFGSFFNLGGGGFPWKLFPVVGGLCLKSSSVGRLLGVFQFLWVVGVEVS